jgi:hypothetical protein
VLRPGESASLSVGTTGSACSWSAYDDASWITITSGASGVGSGTVSYRVAANTGPARTGHVYAAGLTHTVSQEAGCLTSAASPIGMWGRASGTLSTSDCLSRYRVISDWRPYADHYTFSGTAGQQVAILATSAYFDGYMYLIGPAGTVVAQDDDGGGSLNPRIPAGTGYYTLPSTGTYTVEVTGYSINAVGTYTLRLMARVTLTVLPTSGVITGCRKAQGKIVLGRAAPEGGLRLSISDRGLPAASPPSTVTVAAGSLEKSFDILTSPVLADQSGTVTASFGGTGGVSGRDDLTIRPISVETLTLTPNPVVGPNSSTGAIVLECSANPQAITVYLGTTNAAVAWPAVTTLVIPQGTKNGSFTVRTADVSTGGYATIRATANGRTKTKKLTVH